MDYRHWQAITYLEAKANQSAGRAAELLKLSPLFYLLTLYICANGVVTVLTFLWLPRAHFQCKHCMEVSITHRLYDSRIKRT